MDALRVGSGSEYEARYGFCRALRIDGRILVAGTAPIWPSGEVDPEPATQARRCLEIIGDALGQLGVGLHDVVRTRIYITDTSDADEVGRVHGEAFRGHQPVATMIVVAGLLDPRWRVEIEAEAVTG